MGGGCFFTGAIPDCLEAQENDWKITYIVPRSPFIRYQYPGESAVEVIGGTQYTLTQGGGYWKGVRLSDCNQGGALMSFVFQSSGVLADNPQPTFEFRASCNIFVNRIYGYMRSQLDGRDMGAIQCSCRHVGFSEPLQFYEGDWQLIIRNCDGDILFTRTDTDQPNVEYFPCEYKQEDEQEIFISPQQRSGIGSIYKGITCLTGRQKYLGCR